MDSARRLRPVDGEAQEAKRVDTRFGILPMLARRWSPRSFTDQMPELDKLQSMFEAARMAPSAHNAQPARFLLTRKNVGTGYERLFDCLTPGNKE
ncbi:MAG: hypothetical protein QOK47_111, partial [Actinomycetota bacterium]|nr:hypothetical protein [Actinomycetota bacterium]